MAFFSKKVETKEKKQEKTEKQVTNNKKPKIKKTVKQSIPYENVFENGIIEIKPNVFSKSYSFSDMNFSDATEDEQYDVKDQWAKILNMISPEMDLQLSIFNRSVDEAKTYNEMLMRPRQDSYNHLREEANEIIKAAMAEGRNNLETEKYITISFASNSIKEAFSTFQRLDKQIDKGFKAINENVDVEPISIDKRLSILHDIYNPYAKISFDRKFSLNASTNAFKLDNLKRKGLDTKDVIGPEDITYKGNYVVLSGDKYARTVYIGNVPDILTSEFLTDISGQDFSCLTSVYFKQLDPKKAAFMIKNNMTNINKELMEAQKRASSAGYSAALISPDLQQAQIDGMNLLEEMAHSDQKSFLITFAITIFAESLEALDTNTETLSNVVARYTCDLKKYASQQEAAFNTALPLAYNQVEMDRFMQTDSASILIPFSAQDLRHRGGMFFGLNAVSKNVIMINPLRFDNFNAMFLGKPGSGKSMQAKWEIIMKMLTTDDDIYIIDPNNEYRRIAELFPNDSEIIDLAPGSNIHINPLDLDLEYADLADPVASKCDYIYGLVSMAFGTGYILSPTQKSILVRCAEMIYRPYIRHLQTKSEDLNCKISYDYAANPTLLELYDVLMQQDEPEAGQMALALEQYCEGPNAMFAKHTNINPKKRLIIYNIQQLGKSITEFGLYTCMNDAYNRILMNNRIHKMTNVYIDEFHMLIPVDSALSTALMMFKVVRKYGGAMKGITQNVTELMTNPDALKILACCDFVVMMNQFSYEKERLAELYNLSESEKGYITNGSHGCGLIYAGKSVYPFENPIPKDSVFYKAMQTDNKAKDASAILE